MFKNLLPSTRERVQRSTSEKLNKQIYEETLANVSRYVNADKTEINRRICELDREWDTERVLEANASSLIILSTLLGFTRNKNWFILSGIVGLFLLQHSLQGWCPPIPIIRRLGVRTESEINKERNLLKSLSQ